MGCLLRGVKREQVQRGQVIVVPGTIESVKKFRASLYVRSFPPFLEGKQKNNSKLTKDGEIRS